MPIYLYQCDSCKIEKEYIKKYEEKEFECVCGGVNRRLPSFKFNGHGLPNGFSQTRSASREKKEIGGVDDK